MADREVNFTIRATDEFSATFGNAAKDIESLRKQLSLPIQGPLTKAQQSLENNALAKIRTMETAGIRSRMDSLVDKALGIGASEAATAVAPKDAFADFDKLFEGAKSPVRRMDDLAKSTRKAKGEADGLGGSFQGFTKALFTFEMIKRVIDAFDRGSQSATEAVAKYGSSVRGPAILDSIIGAIPGGRFVQRDVVGSPSLDDLDKNYEAKRKIIADSLSLSDQLKSAKFFDSKTVNSNLSDLERQAAAIRKEQFFRVQSLQDEKVKAVDDLEEKYRSGVLTGSDYDKARSAVERDNKRRDELAAAAKSEADAKVVELEKKRNQAIEALRRAHADQIRSIDNDTQQNELQRQGRFLDAKLKQIQDEAEQERLDATRRYNDEVRDPNRAAGAEDRLAKSKRAISDRAAAREKLAREQDSREVVEAARTHADSILATETDNAARRLKIMGRATEAERLQNKQAFEQRMSDIRANLDREIQAHREREPELRRQAEESAAAARDAYDLTNEEIDRRNAFRFRGALPGAVTGETRLLTGALGGAAKQDPLVEPSTRTAKAAEESRKINASMDKKLGDILAALRSPNTPTAKVLK